MKLEKETGKKVISNQKANNIQQLDTKKSNIGE